MFDGSRWFQQTGRTPTLDDYDHKPFFRRHFWPPSALGIIVISVLISMLVGFTGALIYTSSDNAQIAAVDPADQTRVAPTVPPSAEPVAPTTTAPPQVLTPDGITQKLGPSVWTVSSLDESGRPVEGSGFVAGSFGGQTYVLTSLAIVRAATRIPGPEIVVRNGNAQVTATLWTWQEDKDLALLVTGRAAPSIPWADDNPPVKAGDKVYVLAGGGGGPVAGVVSAVSPASIQHNVFVDERRQGAPLLNERGQVLGMTTLGLTPPGAVPSLDTFFAVPIGIACDRVLTCGGGTTTVAPTGLNATTTTTGR
ncbi:MAG TPA: S1C family serine protease [Acidimicrobiales bacterium]|nr:S1C family serine protease [Acidimicrobiales bacterium]